MTSRSLLLLAALPLAAPLSAQRPAADSTATVLGVVVDKLAGTPLPGARVFLEDSRQGTLTDSLGRFELREVPAGTQVMAVHQYGYEEQLFTVRVTAGVTGPVQAELTPRPVALEGFEVVAERLATMKQRLRSRRNATPTSVRAIEEDRLVRSAALDFMEFLRGEAFLFPVRCESGAMASWCVVRRGRIAEPTVYIDEAPAIGGLDQLAMYRPQEFYLVEVYSSGAEIRAYTHNFMERMARRPMHLIPIGVGR